MIYWMVIHKEELGILPGYYEAGIAEKKSDAPEGAKIFRKESTWQKAMDEMDFAEVEEIS